MVDMTLKLPIWYDYTFHVSNTVANTRLFSELLGSIVIGACVDIVFFLLGPSSLVLWPMTLVNIFPIALMLIMNIIEKLIVY